MKTLYSTAVAACALGLLAAACASETPYELTNARTAYQAAAQSPGARLAPTDVDEAKKSLSRAERAFADEGNEPEVRDLAYVAQRKAVLAQSKGNTAIAMEQEKLALIEIDRLRQQQAMAVNQELGRTKAQQKELESERQARELALAKIKGVTTTEDARGTVLTISGNVLFATGKSELLPTAQKRLADVATALKDGNRNLTIIGHTDSTGKPEKNQELSERRAESVRAYLVAHGVAADRIERQGVGSSQPLDDNKTVEGRAHNRRVEIILNVEPGAKGKTAPGGGTP